MASNTRYNQSFPRVANKQARPLREDTFGVAVERCPQCKGPVYHKVSKWGRYKECAKYPRCDWRG